MTQRIIKKYPNRRLYDTETSKYITVSDVRDMVLNNVQFMVIDSNTKEDITRQILMQIIIEAESAGTPLFSADMLSQLIRFYGGDMQGVFTRYLEENFNMLAKQQEELSKSFAKNPMDAFAALTQKNLEMWGEMQKNFMQAAGMAQDKHQTKE